MWHRQTAALEGLFDANRRILVKWCGCFLFINERNGFPKTASADAYTHILLDVLACSIAEYF